MIVLRADRHAAPRVRAGDVGRRAIAAHVVPPVLRVVLDHEDACLRPEPAAADGLDDLAEGEVVVRHLGGWRRRARFSAAGMIVGQTNDAKVREAAALFELLQLADELRGAEDIRDAQLPADRVRCQIRTQ